MPSFAELLQARASMKIYTGQVVLARPDGLGGLETLDANHSTHGLIPNKTDVYFEPRISGVPYYEHSIQEVRNGRSKIGFGNLILINSDGKLDEVFSQWYWPGRPFTLQLGFEELDRSDFQTVFTGRTGSKIKYNDDYITIPIRDMNADLWNSWLAAGQYSDTIPNLVQTCLNAAGITSIDSSYWSTWASENAFDGWIEVSDSDSRGEQVGNILDHILAPIGCWYSFDRSGAFIIGTFKEPDTSTAELSLVDDIELTKFEGETQEQYWAMSLEYYTATGSNPTTDTIEDEDSTIQDQNGEAKEGKTRRSCLTNATQAQTVFNRLWDLYTPLRTTLSLTAKVQAAAIKEHDQVFLQRDRYELSSGRNFRAIGFKEDYSKNSITVTSWGSAHG